MNCDLCYHSNFTENAGDDLEACCCCDCHNDDVCNDSECPDCDLPYEICVCYGENEK